MTNREYPKRPVIGVGVCVFNNSRILLVRRKKEPRIGSWSIPGGGQKIGETIEECARREVREETGQKITNLILLDVVNSISYDKYDKIKYHYTLVEYVCKGASSFLRPGSDAADAKWFSKTEFENLRLWQETKKIILKAYEIDESELVQIDKTLKNSK